MRQYSRAFRLPTPSSATTVQVMDNPTPPRKRASDAERDTAAKHLQDAFADGQISMAEFDERSRALYAATYADELPGLVEDLSPAKRPDREVAPPTRWSQAKAAVPHSRCQSWAGPNAPASGSWRRHTPPSP